MLIKMKPPAPALFGCIRTWCFRQRQLSADTEADFFLIVVSANALVASDEDIINTDANAVKFFLNAYFLLKEF